MLRTVAAMIVFGGCTFVGLRAAHRLRVRRDLLMECSQAVRAVLTGVRHTGRPVWELLRCCDGTRTGTLFTRVAARAEAGERVYDAFLSAAEETGALLELNPEDMRLLTDFFAMLGRSDRQSQTESGAVILSGLSHNQTVAAEAYAGKGRMYRAMGALTGVGVAILLW